MNAPYLAGTDIHVLPTAVPIPGMGFLPVNSYVLHAAEPVLIDTGLADEEAEFIAALESVIDPTSLRWVWLTHDDADHTGNLERVLELAPQAKLVTHGMSAMRMASWWPVPMERVNAIRFGDRLEVGDRTLRAVAPPLFDNPMSTGLIDEATGAYFSVDSFGAILPEYTDDASEVPNDALVGGMAAWASADSPWAHIVDRERFAAVLDRVRHLEPTTILSSHLPAARGASVDMFLDVLATVPDSEPAIAPSSEEFTQMLEAIEALQAQPVAI